MWDTGPKPLKLAFVIDLETLAGKGSSERALVEEIDLTRLPRHIAIIMDGNGRWAKQRGSPRVEGHRAGIASVRETVETCARLELDAGFLDPDELERADARFDPRGKPPNGEYGEIAPAG